MFKLIIIGIFFVICIWVIISFLKNKLKDEWSLDGSLQMIADAYNLKALSFMQKISGIYNGIRVKVSREDIYNDMCFNIHLYHNGKGIFSIGRETSLSKVAGYAGLQDILTGDGEFDDVMLLDADFPIQMKLLMNYKTRKTLTAINRISEYINFNEVYFNVIFPTRSVSSEGLLKLVQKMINISYRYRAIMKKKNSKSILLDNIVTEKHMQVKINQINLLASHVSVADQAVVEILQKIINDATEPLLVRIAAAAYLGQDGEMFLLQLLETQGIENLKEILAALNHCGGRKALAALVELRKTIPYRGKIIPDKGKKNHNHLAKTIVIISERENLSDLDGNLSMPEFEETAGGLSETVGTPEGGLSVNEEKQQQGDG